MGKKNRSNCTLPIGDSLALKKYATILYIPFLKLKGWKKIFYVNVNQKGVRGVMLIPDKKRL